MIPYLLNPNQQPVQWRIQEAPRGRPHHTFCLIYIINFPNVPLKDTGGLRSHIIRNCIEFNYQELVLQLESDNKNSTFSNSTQRHFQTKNRNLQAIYIHTYIHTCMHTDTHRYTHTYVCVCVCVILFISRLNMEGNVLFNDALSAFY